MATTNDLKNGMVLNLDGQLWAVTEFQHVKPGKGGAFVRTTLKNVLSGKVVDRTFNAGTKVDTATVDKRNMTYLYKDGTDFVFMDGETYDQIHVPAETVGGGADYLLENTEVVVAVHEGTPLYVELPVTLELVVQHTDPGLQGDRSTGGTKPATLETGAQIQVPLFVNTGDRLKVAVLMAARSKARKRAVDVLYEADVRGSDPLELLRERVALASPPIPDHAVRLVEGVAEHADRIDELIDRHAHGWSIDRLPDVDRAILRMAVFELLWVDDVPDPVVIDEAVGLARSLSTDDSPPYVNGVLGAILDAEVPTS
jgi:elongation factor P